MMTDDNTHYLLVVTLTAGVIACSSTASSSNYRTGKEVTACAAAAPPPMRASSSGQPVARENQMLAFRIMRFTSSGPCTRPPRPHERRSPKRPDGARVALIFASSERPPHAARTPVAAASTQQ